MIRQQLLQHLGLSDGAQIKVGNNKGIGMVCFFGQKYGRYVGDSNLSWLGVWNISSFEHGAENASQILTWSFDHEQYKVVSRKFEDFSSASPHFVAAFSVLEYFPRFISEFGLSLTSLQPGDGWL